MSIVGWGTRVGVAIMVVVLLLAAGGRAPLLAVERWASLQPAAMVATATVEIQIARLTVPHDVLATDA